MAGTYITARQVYTCKAWQAMLQGGKACCGDTKVAGWQAESREIRVGQVTGKSRKVW